MLIASCWINTAASTWGWWQLIVGLAVLAARAGVISGAAWDAIAGHRDGELPGDHQVPVHPGPGLVGRRPRVDIRSDSSSTKEVAR